MSKSFLHVGCGNSTKKDISPFFHAFNETRLDIDSSVNPDINCSMQDLTSYVSNNQFDWLYCSHALEHLYTHEVPNVLRQFNNVLKRDGVCIILVPDLQTICQRIADNGIDTELYTAPAGPIRAIDALYGYTPAIAQGKIYMQHKTGFTPYYLMNQVLNAGFNTCGVYSESQGYNLACIASNSERSQEELLTIAQQAFKPAT